MRRDVVVELKKLTCKDNILFIQKCREAAELLMLYAKHLGFNSVILQEEGGWYTYEKSAKKLNLNVFKAKMREGKLIKEDFPQEKAIVILNTNPGYAYSENLEFYDDIKKLGSLIVNDVVCSIGDENSLKGDFIIGSFGRDKPLSISSGGAFIAFNDDFDFSFINNLLNENFKEPSINFDELLLAISNLKNKKSAWVSISNKIKKELISKGFNVLNKNDSINIFVSASGSEKKNLIKFCDERNLQYNVCPLYIRFMDEGVCIEIKKINVGDDFGIKTT